MELPKGERPKHPNEKQDVKCDVNCADNHAGEGELPSANFLRRLFILRQRNKSHRQSRNSRQRTKTPKAKDESDYARNHGRQRQTLARTCESRPIGRRRWRLPHRRVHRRPFVRCNPTTRHRRLSRQPLRFLFGRIVVRIFAFGLTNAGVPVWIFWRSQVLDQWRSIVRAEAQPWFLKLPFTLRTVLHFDFRLVPDD